jgi:hypothetical protein
MSENLPNGIPQPLPEASTKTAEEWRDYCAALVAERQRLLDEKAWLVKQCQGLLQVLPVPDHVKDLSGLSPDQVIAKAEFDPPLLEIIKRFEKEHGL